jgi:hypothetical protein
MWMNTAAENTAEKEMKCSCIRNKMQLHLKKFSAIKS